MAGINWSGSFRIRNSSSNFNKTVVNEFLQNFETEYEFDVSTVLNTPKVIADKVGEIVSAERGVLVIFVRIVTGNENTIPPLFVCLRLHLKVHFIEGTLEGLGVATRFSWIN